MDLTRALLYDRTQFGHCLNNFTNSLENGNMHTRLSFEAISQTTNVTYNV